MPNIEYRGHVTLPVVPAVTSELRYCVDCALIILNGENGDPDNFLIRIVGSDNDRTDDCKHDLSGD